MAAGCKFRVPVSVPMLQVSKFRVNKLYHSGRPGDRRPVDFSRKDLEYPARTLVPVQRDSSAVRLARVPQASKAAGDHHFFPKSLVGLI